MYNITNNVCVIYCMYFSYIKKKSRIVDSTSLDRMYKSLFFFVVFLKHKHKKGILNKAVDYQFGL